MNPIGDDVTLKASTTPRRLVLGLAFLLAIGVVGACGDDDDSASPGTDPGGGESEDTGDCIVVDMAVSSEKITLLQTLADEFNDSGAEANGRCIFVRPRSVSSGNAANLIVEGWPNPDVNGEAPVIWSPAASAWAGIVNERAGSELAPAGTPFMLTPLVITMPQKMAEALGWPDDPIGFADLRELANDPEGWGSVGHPEWGPFRLGKTNPNYSTSGLNFTIAEYYAATGKTSDLTREDLQRPAAVEFATDIESAVVHYGDITMTFLNNWFAADARGTALTYASAVAVEEKSVIDYNLGDPDGVLAPGEQRRPPREPLVAIYPEEGTLFSDSPFIVLNTDWVDDDERAAAEQFETFVQLPVNQELVMDFGFRPNNPDVALAAPIVAENGVDPEQPRAELGVPEPDVLVGILESWAELRKEARVLLVLDVSGSMADPGGSSGQTKLDLAKAAAISALDEFKDEDDVGLWVFSTDLGGDHPNWREVVPIGPIAANRETLATQIDAQVPVAGTPLYEVTQTAYETMVEEYDPDAINAIVLLTDGVNDDEDPSDNDEQFETLIETLEGPEGEATTPVRVFTISYGEDADIITLRAISQASGAATYNASNPATIEQVFTAVISNF